MRPDRDFGRLIEFHRSGQLYLSEQIGCSVDIADAASAFDHIRHGRPDKAVLRLR